MIVEHQNEEMRSMRREQATPARERRENRHVSSNSLVRCLPPQPIMQVCQGSAAAAHRAGRNGSLIVVRISSLPRHWHHLLATHIQAK
eukprot:scaffold52547_cov68-Phaeocystis_antarctica.AAC.2